MSEHKSTKTNKNKGRIAKAILLTIGAVGLMAIPVAGPLTLNKFSRRRVSQSLRHLRDTKVIEVVYQKGKTTLILTEKGRNKLVHYNLDDLRIPKPKHWDGKWRLVIFDIPEKFRLGSDYLRNRLKQAGFYQLQKSAWIYSYPCEEVIDALREVYEVKPFVSLIIAQIP